MSTQELAKVINHLQKAYLLVSQFTNLPYVECEQENYNDQALLFESEQEAKEAAGKLSEAENRVKVQELKAVEVLVPADPKKPEGPKKKMFLNQVRQQLGVLPYMGVNAVGYKASGKETKCVELEEILPEDYEKKIAQNPLYQPNLQLTGIYLMQQARKKKEAIDRKQLVELDEEFGSNLVKAKLFVVVTPPEGHEKDPQLNLKECKLPFLRQPDGNSFFPLFTDIWECQKYIKNNKNFRPIQVPFQDISKFWVQEARAYIINPVGFSIPIAREQVPKLLEKFGVSSNPS